ncbi:MAG: hypothetical protein ACJAYR_003614 [Sneathiella sp.]|jgi:hypothetical protein
MSLICPVLIRSFEKVRLAPALARKKNEQLFQYSFRMEMAVLLTFIVHMRKGSDWDFHKN